MTILNVYMWRDISWALLFHKHFTTRSSVAAAAVCCDSHSDVTFHLFLCAFTWFHLLYVFAKLQASVAFHLEVTKTKKWHSRSLAIVTFIRSHTISYRCSISAAVTKIKLCEGWKSSKFPILCIRCLCWGKAIWISKFPLVQKTKMMGLPGGEEWLVMA